MHAFAAECVSNDISMEPDLCSKFCRLFLVVLNVSKGYLCLTLGFQHANMPGPRVLWSCPVLIHAVYRPLMTSCVFTTLDQGILINTRTSHLGFALALHSSLICTGQDLLPLLPAFQTLSLNRSYAMHIHVNSLKVVESGLPHLGFTLGFQRADLPGSGFAQQPALCGLHAKPFPLSSLGLLLQRQLLLQLLQLPR